jgi:addiction module HigA family antidote
MEIAMTATIAGNSVDPLAPIHPGEILLEEFIKPFRLSPGKTAKRLRIARPRIEKLVRGQTPITVDTALRLEKLFGVTAQFWLNLQTEYDLEMAKPSLAGDIEMIEPIDIATIEPINAAA